MIDVKNPFEVKILLVYENLQAQNAASRAVRKLKEDLEIEGSNIIIADNLCWVKIISMTVLISFISNIIFCDFCS